MRKEVREPLDAQEVLNLIDKFLLEFIDTYEVSKQDELKQMLPFARSFVLCDVLYDYNDDTLLRLGPQWNPDEKNKSENQGYPQDTLIEIVTRLIEIEPNLEKILRKQVPISAKVIF